MTNITDEYYIIVKTDGIEEVLNFLNNNGFLIKVHPSEINFDSSPYDDDSFVNAYETPIILSNCSALVVKGKGNILKTPQLIYSNNLYYNDTNKRITGLSNTFYIHYDKKDEIKQIEKILKHADILQFAPLYNGLKSSYIYCACTNASAGNPVELSNWFVEELGFPAAYPSFELITLD